MSRKDWDDYFMNLALAASERATCPRRHVGAILVDHTNRVISTGYNGSEPGKPHCDEAGCVIVDGKCKRTIHAEKNAITRVKLWDRAGSKLYTTDFPCKSCADLVLKSGIVEVIYTKEYLSSKDYTLALFEKEGIVIRQYDPR